MEQPFIMSIALAISAGVAAVLTHYARGMGSLDTPNERSSHTVSTPSGGGLAIVATSCTGFLVLAWFGLLDRGLASALIVGGLAVAAVGLADDHRAVSVRIRLAVHFGAAIWAVFLIGGGPFLQVGAAIVELRGPWLIVSVIGIVWVLNLFNFMDGVDGIAASEGIFVSLAGSMLAGSILSGSSTSLAAMIFVGSCLGFLVWNWPPAKIFMGDVGSGYLGYVIATLVLFSAADNPVAVWVWLVLGGLFFLDATTTLIRRLMRGERVYRAHREHAYQWLARRWRGHRPVTLALIAVNTLWLLPAAVLCVLEPRRSVYIVAGAFIPLLALIVLSGAGDAEDGTHSRAVAGSSGDG